MTPSREVKAAATLAERERIIRILKSELTGNDQMLEELIYLINDVNVL
jgi:hypothetical protein